MGHYGIVSIGIASIGIASICTNGVYGISESYGTMTLRCDLAVGF